QHTALQQIIVPSNGASVRGSSVVLGALAGDNIGVTRVEFRATGGSLSNALIGTGQSSPYGWIMTWNTTTVANRSYQVRSVAFDAAGNTTTSAPRTVIVSN
ncbi:MAG: Ig-like domain-containing protein, partial [Acidimicrobiia bacterium]